MWGHRVCQWSDCLPRLSHTPPVSVRHSHVSPLRPGCLSPPLLPVWMNVYFLFPWCRTSLPFDFLSVLVVQGGAVCLPTPPSWFSDGSVLKQMVHQRATWALAGVFAGCYGAADREYPVPADSVLGNGSQRGGCVGSVGTVRGGGPRSTGRRAKGSHRAV